MTEMSDMTEMSENLHENLAAVESVGDMHTLEEIDYTSLPFEEIRRIVEQQRKQTDLLQQYALYRKLRPIIEEHLHVESHQALDKFVQDGGVSDDFEFKADSFYKNFESYYQTAKNFFNQHQKEQQHKKEANLKHKLQLIDQLRSLVEGPDTKSSYDTFKTIQQDWKSTGAVPQEQSQELWNNYHALISRYYDKRQISFELLELDRKRNLQAKLHLIDRVKKLASEPSIQKALKELEEIHEEFRHIGPVVKEQQEEVWQAFKDATAVMHERRKQHIEQIKAQQEKSLIIKQSILEQLQTEAKKSPEKSEEWAAISKQVEQLQEQWKKSGFVAKDKAKELNKTYWDTLKVFYSNKRQFFKEADKIRKENLQKKTQLCEKVEALLTAEDLDKTADQIIQLQKEWKTIGHVPLKMKDKIYDRFKKGCDAFFEQKRQAYKSNQESNKQLVSQRAQFIQEFAAKKLKTWSDVEAEIATWHSLPEIKGFDAAKIYDQFAQAVKSKGQEVSADPDSLEQLVAQLQVLGMKLSPDFEKDKIQREKKLRKEIRDIEDEIAQLKNNMEFFARSKNAEQIRKDFSDKIEKSEARLKQAKAKLKVLVC